MIANDNYDREDCIMNRENMLKLFLLFESENDHPNGGANDLFGIFLSLDGAMAALASVLVRQAAFDVWLDTPLEDRGDEPPDWESSGRTEWAHIIEIDECEVMNRWEWRTGTWLVSTLQAAARSAGN